MLDADTADKIVDSASSPAKPCVITDAYLARQHGLHDYASALQHNHVTQRLARLQHHHIARQQPVRGYGPHPPIPHQGGQPALIHQGNYFLTLTAEGMYEQYG